MTNRIDELDSLRTVDNISFYKDFDLLDSIDDNYFLYCIENVIMRNAKIRCSTFNVKLQKPNNNYYNCYLTNYPGMQ